MFIRDMCVMADKMAWDSQIVVMMDQRHVSPTLTLTLTILVPTFFKIVVSFDQELRDSHWRIPLASSPMSSTLRELVSGYADATQNDRTLVLCPPDSLYFSLLLFQM